MKKLIMAAAAFAAITTGANALNAQGGWLNGEDEEARKQRLFTEVLACEHNIARQQTILNVIEDEIEEIRFAFEFYRDFGENHSILSNKISWREGLLTMLNNRIGNCDASISGLVQFIHDHNYAYTIRNNPDFIINVANWYHETVGTHLTLDEIEEARNQL